MAFDAIDVGIVPGGLRNKSDIKLLICYILKSVKAPLRKDDVINIVSETGLANYFEAIEAFDTLIKNKNIICTNIEKDLFVPTDSGFLICKELEDELPTSVKEKAFCSAFVLLEQQRIERENIVKIKKNDKGYTVNCSIGDEQINLLEIKLYVPEDCQAKLVKKNFQKNADLIYKIMIAALTNNKDLVKEALNNIDNPN